MPHSASRATATQTVTIAVPALFLFLGSVAATAQNVFRPIEMALPAGRSSSVYLNDSFEAFDAIQRARRLVDKGQWREAVELAQGISDDAGDKLIRASDDRFVGVREYVNRWIAEWPPAGLEAYRRRVEPKAAEAVDALRRSQRIDAFVEIFDRYFCTPSAAKLADTIGQLALESGDLSLGRSVYRRVIELHPDRSAYARSYGAMLHLIEAIEGVSISSPALYAGEKIRWMGQDRLLKDVLSEIASFFPGGTDTAAAAHDWPMVGGERSRARRQQTRVDNPGLLWSAPYSGAASARPDPRAEEIATKSTARSLSAQPAIAAGRVYVQHGRELLALHRNSGALAWRFRLSETSVVPEEREDAPPGWDAPTVRDGRVYFVAPGDTGSYYGSDSARNVTEVIALDAASGRLIWRTGDQFRLDRATELSLDSSLLVSGNRVYATGRRRRSFGFEDCYLYAFDASSGTLIYRTHLGSASTGTLGSRIATMSVPSKNGDVIYICTNLGAVAGVAASTGNVLWLRVYDRDATSAGQSGGWAARERMPWEVNPAILSGDRVICLPSDSHHLLVLSASDGELIRSVPLADMGHAQTLLGIQDNLLCTAGQKIACYDLSSQQARFAVEFADENALHGRGAWVDDALWIPTRTHLLRFAVGDGRRTESPWPQDADPGNIVATQEQILVAGSRSISAFVRKSEIWNALRERMVSGPADPIPALELAEVALRSGDLTEALDSLDEAARRAGALPEPPDNAMRRRFFDAVLAFVDVLAARSRLEPATLDRLFDYATTAAPDADAHVAYRLRFGWLLETRDQPARAISLYQQILRDRSLREATIPSSGPVPASAGSTARARIAALIDREGPSIYSPYESEATRWLENARAARDTAALVRVAETFPNSTAAPLAYAAHAELLADAGRHEEAARWYARAYYQYSRVADRPALMKSIADAYENAGRREHAYRWLTKAAREYPAAKVEIDGKTLSFLEYRERLADVRATLEPARPDVRLPLTEGFVRTFDGSVSLLTPRFADEPAARFSRAFVYTPGQLRAMNIRDGSDLWSQPATIPVKPDLLLATDETVLFATLHGVLALNAATGETLWSLGALRPPGADPDADWEDGLSYRNVVISGNRLVAVRDDGRIEFLDWRSGKVLWTRTHRPVTSGLIRAVDRWVIYPVMQDEQIVVCILDAATGDWRDAILTGEEQAVEDIFVTLDGQVVLITLRSILAYDLESRGLRWRYPVDGRIRRETLDLDMDALVFSDDAVTIEKINLEDGKRIWQSDRLAASRDDDMRVDRQGSSILVTTSSGIIAVDSAAGHTLWKGTAPRDARFLRREITTAYVVALHIPHPPKAEENRAFFYDHRNASGVLPRDGGVLPLGDLGDMRAFFAADNAILIQTGSAIEGWTGK